MGALTPSDGITNRDPLAAISDTLPRGGAPSPAPCLLPARTVPGAPVGAAAPGAPGTFEPGLGDGSADGAVEEGVAGPESGPASEVTDRETGAEGDAADRGTGAGGEVAADGEREAEGEVADRERGAATETAGLASGAPPGVPRRTAVAPRAVAVGAAEPPIVAPVASAARATASVPATAAAVRPRPERLLRNALAEEAGSSRPPVEPGLPSRPWLAGAPGTAPPGFTAAGASTCAVAACGAGGRRPPWRCPAPPTVPTRQRGWPYERRQGATSARGPYRSPRAH